MDAKHKNGRPRAKTHGDDMLVEFLRAKTPHEKREVIKQYAPMYYMMTPTTSELKQRKENQDESGLQANT